MSAAATITAEAPSVSRQQSRSRSGSEIGRERSWSSTVIGSRYLGNMQHLTGMLFTALPPGVTVDEFLDRHGRLILMDPMLRENLDEDVKRSTRRRRQTG